MINDLVMIWSWEDGRKKRHYYSVSSVAQLENQPTAASMEVYSEGKLYNVDVKNKLHIPKFAMYREESGLYSLYFSSSCAL